MNEENKHLIVNGDIRKWPNGRYLPNDEATQWLIVKKSEDDITCINLESLRVTSISFNFHREYKYIGEV
jgi:hypothetical protein